ncbi:hypothetical protein CHH83_12350, partial [Bacillus sp. 7586-K]
MNRIMKKIVTFLSVFMILFSVSFQPIASAAESNNLADGKYTIHFNVLKNGTESISVMDGYTEKPAMLIVNGDEKFVELTLKNSDWIQLFQTKYQGEFRDAQVISENKAVNTRVVRFQVEDLSQKLDAYTHVVITSIPGFSYDNYYTVQIQFDMASIQAINPSLEQP